MDHRLRDVHVVVTGLPASGKSTLAGDLARQLELPLLSKDVIKEALGDVLGADDRAGSALLGAASFEVLFALARLAPAAVLETYWHRERSVPSLRALDRPMVEVWCNASRPLCQERFLDRRAADRHPVHQERLMDDDELRAALAEWPEATPLGLGPLVEVDSSIEVDVAAVAREVLAAVGRST